MIHADARLTRACTQRADSHTVHVCLQQVTAVEAQRVAKIARVLGERLHSYAVPADELNPRSCPAPPTLLEYPSDQRKAALIPSSRLLHIAATAFFFLYLSACPLLALWFGFRALPAPVTPPTAPVLPPLPRHTSSKHRLWGWWRQARHLSRPPA